jgi:23S rRNA (uracil1939-C5)-methyltransferase
LQELVEKSRTYDITILDPPRKGCSEAALNAANKLTQKYIIYVSCNPATLARDLQFLSNNFIPEFVQPVDMFCHTYHIESIAVLRKSDL